MDNNQENPEVCVGQKVSFQVGWSPALPTGTVTEGRWLIAPEYYNTITPSTGGASPLYSININLLTNNPTAPVWFYEKAGAKYVGGTWTNTFSNGQSLVQERHGNINVYRPSIVNFSDGPTAYPTNASDLGILYLQLGDSNAHGDMEFEVDVFSKYSGRSDFTQLVNRYGVNGSLTSSPYTTYGYFDLDNNVYYLNQTSDPNGAYTVQANVIFRHLLFSDNPGIQLVATLLGGYTTSANDQFQDYVMFRPDAGNASDNIYVCLGKSTWKWNATTTYTSGVWPLPRGSVTRPASVDNSYGLPTWPGTYINH